MARRRRKLTLDPCKVQIRRLKRLGGDALFKVGHRIRYGVSSRRRRDEAMRTLGLWAENYGAAKVSQKIHAGDPKIRAHAVRVYLRIARRLEKEFRVLQSKSCPR